MITQKTENVVNFIREARDAEDNLGWRVLFFFTFLIIGFTVIFFAFVLCWLAFTFPKVFIPLYFTIFILWQGYKRF